MKKTIEELEKIITNAYIRVSKYTLKVDTCNRILEYTRYQSFPKREDNMLGYVEFHIQKGKIYTSIYYEKTDDTLKLAMILTHELGHALITSEPIFHEDGRILYIKRGLEESYQGKTTNDYLEEGFLEYMSTCIWEDPIFLLDLEISGIKATGFEYKDRKIFKKRSFYEEYKNLYMFSNLLFQNDLYEAAFAPDMKEFLQKNKDIDFVFFQKRILDACEGLNHLYRVEVKNPSTLGYYFEEYQYKKQLLLLYLDALYALRRMRYTEEEKKNIKSARKLYQKHPEYLLTLKLTDLQTEKYYIKKEEETLDIRNQKIREMPKIELHLHLDGSLRRATMEDILQRKISKKEVTATNEEDLNGYLTKFSLPGACMQTRENIKRVAKELVEDLSTENVLYAEIRFAPQKHREGGLSLMQVVESALAGLKEVPLVKTKLILCMMRGDSFLKNKEVIEVAKKYQNKGVVALDLAGAEALYPTSEYESLFAYAGEMGIPLTIHAGEAAGEDSIQAALQTGTKRIGHGVRILENKTLVKEAKEKHIVFEICPVSNIQTGVCDSYETHPLYEMYQKGLMVTINTDNRTVSGTTLTKEYIALKEAFSFQIEDFVKMNMYAIEGSFLRPIEKERLKENFQYKLQELP